MKREEALKLLSKIEAYRKTPAMDNAERDITCRIIAAMVPQAGGFKSRNERTAETKSATQTIQPTTPAGKPPPV